MKVIALLSKRSCKVQPLTAAKKMRQQERRERGKEIDREIKESLAELRAKWELDKPAVPSGSK